jgi:hypothetical protein
MAGKCSTDLFCPGSESDRGHIPDFIEAWRKARPDHETVLLLRWLDENPGSDPDDLYSYMKPQIESVLTSRQGRRAIKALAKELLRVGAVSGQRAAGVLAKAWGAPLPEKALPVSKHLALTAGRPTSFDDLIRAAKQYTALMTADVRALRDSCTDEENEHLDSVWAHLVHLGLLVK